MIQAFICTQTDRQQVLRLPLGYPEISPAV